MVTTIKKRKFAGSKKRFIGKPTGQIQERVQAVGPEHFGIVSVDCAKRRSKWMLCNCRAGNAAVPNASATC